MGGPGAVIDDGVVHAQPLGSIPLIASGAQLPSPVSGPRSLHVVSRAGSDVASGCGIQVSPNVASGLRGAFTAEGPLDIWDVGPNTPTSDEDEDGVVKPKKGHGRVGMGPPIMISHGGTRRPIIDGSGLCSPGRWMPASRAVDSIAAKIRPS